MQLSLHTDYSLRVLIYLGLQGRRSTIAEIAEFFTISKDHLAKVAQRLAHLGFIRSVRGIGGGLELARDPESIRIGDVIQQLEDTALLECVHSDETVCVIQPGCKLRGVLAKAEQVQLDYLNTVRLTDVIDSNPKLVPLSNE